MEVIHFINDLRKMGNQYYNVWLPIILQFHKKEEVIISLSVPIDVPKSSYYRIIEYGLCVFKKHISLYELKRNRNSLVLSVNQNNYQDFLNKYPETKKQTETANDIQAVEVVVEKPKPQRKKAQETSYPNEYYEEIISFLNHCTGKNYKNTSTINRKFITQRLNEGFTVEDFMQVISVKTTNWLGSKMEQFLRPETLFSNKFESYLNENIVSNSPSSNLKNTYDQVNIATEYFSNQE